MQAGDRRYIPLRRLNWLALAAVMFAVCNFLFVYKYLEVVAHRGWLSPVRIYLEQFTGFIAGLAVFPLLYWTATRFPLLTRRWWRHLPIHLLAASGISVIHTSLMAVQRNVLFPALGFGPYNYGYMPVRYVMEFAFDCIMYCVTIGFIYFFHEVHFAQERELRQAEMEARLSEARLQNLRLQLEPHFLFNALNAISAAVYENPRVADEMIGRLSDLLRAVLRNDRRQEVTLAREVDLLQLYTRVMEARLEERLKVDVSVTPEARDCLVPQLILQPLVENAIRHGADPASFHVDVKISALRENGHIRILVRDHGPGLSAASPKTGIGLQNTRERLERLYGDSQRFTLRTAQDGGVEAELELPFHTESVAGDVA